MRSLTGGVVLAVALGLVAAGCNNNIPTSTTPTTPTTTVTEAFSGTVSPNGAATFFFSTGAGFLTATLKTLNPDSTIQIGLALGTWNGVTCQTTIVNDQATQGQAVSGNASAAGGLCVRIFDANGTVLQPNTFEIVVVHP